MSTEGSRRFRANHPGYDAAMRKKHQLTYVEAVRKTNTRRLYGISADAAFAMFEEQGHSCKVCGTTNPNDNLSRWHVDHDHATGEVRGVLCPQCNKALGLMKDSAHILRAAADYLDPPTEGFKKFLSLYPTSSLSMMK